MAPPRSTVWPRHLPNHIHLFFMLSTQCLLLTDICIDLKTTILVQDILSVFKGQEGRSEADGQNSKRNLRMRRRHPLKLLFVYDLPLGSHVDAEGIEVVSKGLLNLFVVIDDELPVMRLNWRHGFWIKVSQEIETLQALEGFAV